MIPRPPYARHVLFASTLAVAVTGCGGGGDGGTGPDPNPDPPVATTVVIAGAPTATVVGDTTQLTASVRDQFGRTMGGASVTWQAVDAALVDVAASGRVISRAAGAARVVARSGSVADTAAFTVAAREAATVTVDLGGTFFLTGDVDTLEVAVADQRGRPLSGVNLTFSSLNNAVVQVSQAGVVTAQGPGTTTVQVSAALPATVGDVQGAAAATTAQGEITVEVARGSGPRFPALADLDRSVVEWMEAENVPGAVLAVMRDGRLVYARGYGVRDVTGTDPVLPTSLFRLGSISKPIAGVAILEALEQGLLQLDDLPYVVLDATFDPLPGESVDPRLMNATVEDLLRHQTGWSTDRAVDGRVWEGVWKFGNRTPEGFFPYGFGFTPADAPGELHAYTNFDTQTLGLYLESVTGADYETWVQQNLLTPAGAGSIQYGETPLGARHPDEVRYHGKDGQPSTYVDSDSGELEYADAAGRWIATAPDLLRFVRAVDGRGGVPPLLTPGSVDLLESRNAALWPDPSFYSGLHWYVRTDPSGATWMHDGAAAGHYSRVVRRADGLAVAFFINRSLDLAASEPLLDIETLIAGRMWPDVDLFDIY